MNTNKIYGMSTSVDYGFNNIEGEKKRCEKSGKIMYTKREAGTIINGIKGHKNSSHMYRGTNKPQRMYYCEYCNSYHVTHYNNKMKTRKEKQSRIELSYGKGFDYDSYMEYEKYMK